MTHSSVDSPLLVERPRFMAMQKDRNNYNRCPIRYRTRHFFNNSNTNEDIATKFEQEYIRIAIRLPTDATVYFVYLFPSFTLHVSGSHKPIIRGVSSCFLYTTVWFMQCLCCSSAFVVKPSQQTSPQAHPDEQHKHCMNQMVVYKKQLETPLMMGL